MSIIRDILILRLPGATVCQELPSLSNTVRFLSEPLIRKAHQSPPPPKREVCFNQKAFHSDVIGNNFLMNLMLFPRLACGPYLVGCLRALPIALLEINWKNGFQLHKISRTGDSLLPRVHQDFVFGSWGLARKQRTVRDERNTSTPTPSST